MEQYNAVPAKRLLNLVQKYSHHVHMKEIEGNLDILYSIHKLEGSSITTVLVQWG